MEIVKHAMLQHSQRSTSEYRLRLVEAQDAAIGEEAYV